MYHRSTRALLHRHFNTIGVQFMAEDILSESTADDSSESD